MSVTGWYRVFFVRSHLQSRVKKQGGRQRAEWAGTAPERPNQLQLLDGGKTPEGGGKARNPSSLPPWTELIFSLKKMQDYSKNCWEDPCHFQPAQYSDFPIAIAKLSPKTRASSEPGVFIIITSDCGVTDAVPGERRRKYARATQKITQTQTERERAREREREGEVEKE